MQGLSQFLKRETSHYLLLALATVAVYANGMSGAFVFDDQGLILTNTYLRDWSRLPDLLTSLTYAGAGMEKGFFRPFVMFIYFLIYQFIGPEPAAYHIFNLIVHTANVLLMYRLGRIFGFAPVAVFAASLLWAVHPVHTENVTYISSTPDLLALFFVLLGLIEGLPDFSRARMVQVVPFFLLALACKETAVIFPALAAASLFLIGPEQARLKLATYKNTALLWAIAVIYFAVYMYLRPVDPFIARASAQILYAESELVRIYTSLATLPHLLGLLIYPMHLYMERTFPFFVTPIDMRVFLGAAIVALALAFMLWGRAKRGVPVTFGFIWFAAALAPLSGIVVPIDALIAEAWLYMQTVGLFLGVAQVIYLWLQKSCPAARKVTVILVAVAAVLFSLKTIQQNRVYDNAETLYFNVFKEGGSSVRAWPDLAAYYMMRGDFDKAIHAFKKSIEKPDINNIPVSRLHAQLALAYLGVKAEPNYNISLPAIAAGVAQSKHIPEAMRELQTAIELDPKEFLPHGILATIYDSKGEKKKAEKHYAELVRLLNEAKARAR